jgi:glutamate-1-semialdehyde 2,1-aminomutase
MGAIVAGHIDQNRLSALLERESATFAERTARSAALLREARQCMPDGVPMAWMAGLYAHPPLFVAGGEGGAFSDVDGHRYIDFNLADLSNTIGYGANAVSARIAAQAARGIQHLLPTEDALAVATELRRRTGFPFWQFTGSASAANAEIIRIARAFTRREKIVVFEGRYHGHLDTTMGEGGKTAALGVSRAATRDTIMVPFNDLDSLARVLAQGDTALVITEPALTNCGLVLPEDGFLNAAHALCRRHGALFALDETHTWQFAYGGMLRALQLGADFVALGKGLGTGMALGAYGMTADLASYLEQNRDSGSSGRGGLAIGGTTFASAITMAAVRAGLEEILTEPGYARVARLGGQLADGIQAMIHRHDLPWRTFRCGPRSGFCLTPELPRSYRAAVPSLDPTLSAARRLFMANRGVWDAISSAGPQVSFAHSEADVGRYVELAGEFLDALVAH